MKKLVFIAVVLGWFTGVSSAQNKDVQYQTGDIIFQTTSGKIAKVTAAATLSPITHVGMIIMKKGKPYIIEASGPVRIVSFKKFIGKGVGKRFVVKRFNKDLSPVDKKRLRRAARRHLGKPYDSKFMWSNKKMYCSELVYKAYMSGLKVSLATPQKGKDIYNRFNPIVVKYGKKKYGKKLPLEETIVTPVRLFNSDQLNTVKNTYFKLL